MNVKPEIDLVDNLLESIVAKIVNKDFDDFYSKKFNTKDLPEHKNFSVSPNTYLPFRYMFEELDLKENHCLYWFELETVAKAQALNNLIDNYRLKKNEPFYRTVPATNKNKESNVLYVGVRRGHKNKAGLKNIVGRINQHLGYYKSNKTQGLQLYHYAKGLDFEININVVEFKDLVNPMYLNLIEKMVADKLEPLCGRH